MGSNDKPEFPPLLPPGSYPMHLSDLHSLFVKRFNISKTRSKLLSNFCSFVWELERRGIAGKIWCDGSFVTSKIDPPDVDLFLAVDGCWYYNDPTPGAMDYLDWIDSDDGWAKVKDEFCCDAYVAIECSPDQPQWGSHEKTYQHWRKWFSVSRGGIRRGLAIIEIQPHAVDDLVLGRSCKAAAGNSRTRAFTHRRFSKW
jgi:hypothetical protein